MRNGNFCYLLIIAPQTPSFYPTYEEWKHMNGINYSICNILFILPMRNGNVWKTLLPLMLYELFILPMRNGNNSLQRIIITPSCSFYPTYEEWKRKCKFFNKHIARYLFILPMRNGNMLGVTIEAVHKRFLSYLWGMETIKFNERFKPQFSFYPTYEEWKPSKYFCSFVSLKLLFILPMRNGNKMEIKLLNEEINFLSYLWGMETC